MLEQRNLVIGLTLLIFDAFLGCNATDDAHPPSEPSGSSTGETPVSNQRPEETPLPVGLAPRTGQ